MTVNQRNTSWANRYKMNDYDEVVQFLLGGIYTKKILKKKRFFCVFFARVFAIAMHVMPLKRKAVSENNTFFFLKKKVF